jgi:hypothetical protein
LSASVSQLILQFSKRDRDLLSFFFQIHLTKSAFLPQCPALSDLKKNFFAKKIVKNLSASNRTHDQDQGKKATPAVIARALRYLGTKIVC